MHSIKLLLLAVIGVLATTTASASNQPTPQVFKITTIPLTVVNHAGFGGYRIVLVSNDDPEISYFFEIGAGGSPTVPGFIVPGSYDVNVFNVFDSSDYFGLLICDTYYDFSPYFFMSDIPLSTSCSQIDIY